MHEALPTTALEDFRQDSDACVLVGQCGQELLDRIDRRLEFRCAHGTWYPSKAMSLPSLTILELTRLISAQDDRWARSLSLSQSARNPAAPAGIVFFKKTWRPLLDRYFSDVAARYAPAAKVPAHVITWIVGEISDVIYPAARRVGFSEQSLLLPELSLEQRGHPATVSGAAPPGPETRASKASRIAFAAFLVSSLGISYHVHNVHRLHRAALRAV